MFLFYTFKPLAAISARRTTNIVRYDINLTAGSGLSIDNSTGTIKLANCSNGQVLKATSADNGWACADDFYTEQPETSTDFCSIASSNKVVWGTVISTRWGKFVTINTDFTSTAGANLDSGSFLGTLNPECSPQLGGQNRYIDVVIYGGVVRIFQSGRLEYSPIHNVTPIGNNVNTHVNTTYMVL
jgi:hypothetical protein